MEDSGSYQTQNIDASGMGDDVDFPQSDRVDLEKSILELYDAQGELLVKSLRNQFGNGPPEPEDIVQQAFQKLLERRNQPDILNLEGFLWRTARNLMLTEKRNTAVRSKYEYEIKKLFFASNSSDSDPNRALIAEEQLKAINAALAIMPEKRRRAFVLHRIDGLNLSATGRQLGITGKAVVKHISKAIVDIDNALSNGKEHKK
ncbi:MAG: sigma-70 family RNA polymerase sigma factor [Pseudomonadota bacterium]